MKKKEKKRLEMLEQGINLMNRQGYHASGIQELTDSLDMTKGSFYNYFSSKEDFTIQLIEHHQAESEQSMAVFLQDQSLPPLKRLEAMFQSWMHHYQHHTGCTRGCLLGNLAQEMADTNDAIRQILEQCTQCNVNLIAGVLRQAQEEGSLSRLRDADTLARFIWNSWEGSLVRMKTSRSALDLQLFWDVLINILLRET